MRLTVVTLAAVTAALAVLTGCTPAPEHACTLIGAESGVSFDVADGVPASVTSFQAQACVDDQCVDQPGRRGEPTWLFVHLEGATAARSATARLTLRSEGAVVFEASVPVTLKQFQPNGPGCDPTVYQARVTATSAGTLVAA